MADTDRSDIGTKVSDTNVKPQAEASGQETPEQRAHREARRRVLAGGLASAPFVLTLASRPAMGWGGDGGGHCGYSGTMSGNMSHPTTTESTWCQGKTPKYWKTSERSCDKVFAPGPGNPMYMDYTTYKDYSVPSKHELYEYKTELEKNYWYNWYKIQECNKYLYWLDRYPGLDSPPFGTKFSEIFGGGIAQDHELTLMQALWLDDESPDPPSGNAGPVPLLAHCAAAYCNASEFGETKFGLSPWGIVDLVRTEISRDPHGLEEMLRMMNNQSYQS